MKDLIKEFEQYLEVDEDNIDREIARMPSLFFTVSDHYVDACKKRDKLRNKREVIAARMTNDIRSDYTDDKIKFTETSLQQKVIASAKYTRAHREYLIAKYEAERWDALRQAMLQKSFALKSTVDLLVNKAYQDSSVKLDTSDARGVRGDQARKRLRDKRRGKERNV